LLFSIEYREGSEFQFGTLLDYVALCPTSGKEENAWAGPADYAVDLSRLRERLEGASDKIAAVSYQVSPDMAFTQNGGLSDQWKRLNLE